MGDRPKLPYWPIPIVKKKSKKKIEKETEKKPKKETEKKKRN